jgi:O-antigen/teichoic acid export membrane protein
MLSKQLISSVLIQIPVFVLGVVSGIFSTRILGEEAKGIFSLFQANSQLFVLLFSVGIQTGIVYFISSHKMSEKKIIGMTIRIFGISSLSLLVVLALIHFTGATEFILSKDYSSILYLLILFLLYLFTFLNSVVNSFLQAKSKFKYINFVALAGSIFNALVFMILFWWMQRYVHTVAEKLNYVLYATIVVLLFNTVLWFFFYKREYKESADPSFDLEKELKPFVLYNSAIFLGMLINFLNYRLDLWIVNNLLPQKELSYYSLAANINQIILYVSVTIATVMLPNLSGKSDEERNRTFTRISRISFSFFAIIVLFAWIVADGLIPFVYGVAFAPSVLPFKILLPGVLLSCNTQLFATLIVASKKNILNIIATSLGLAVTLTLDLCLIPLFGITGAAYATVASYGVIFISTFYLSLRKLQLPLANYFILTKDDVVMLKQQLGTLLK